VFVVVTLLLAELAIDVPFDPNAVTVNVYEVLCVSPATVIGDDAPDAVIFPGDEVTVYDVIETFVGAVKDTETELFPVTVADTFVGASGTGET
jgi:hypothetical protein